MWGFVGEAKMDNATQAMYALIEVIKGTESLAEDEAHIVLGLYYPAEEVEWRLNIYIQALFELGVIEVREWDYMESFIYDALEGTLSRMMPNIRVYADELIKACEEPVRLLNRKAELEAMLADGDPRKITPDEESMEFWNMMAPEVMEYDMNQVELEDVNRQLEG